MLRLARCEGTQFGEFDRSVELGSVLSVSPLNQGPENFLI